MVVFFALFTIQSWGSLCPWEKLSLTPKVFTHDIEIRIHLCKKKVIRDLIRIRVVQTRLFSPRIWVQDSNQHFRRKDPHIQICKLFQAFFLFRHVCWWRNAEMMAICIRCTPLWVVGSALTKRPLWQFASYTLVHSEMKYTLTNMSSL